MSGPHSSGLYHFYRLQPTVGINLTAPDPLYVINTWIPVLPQTANVMLFWVKGLVNPNRAQQVRWIIDGTTYLATNLFGGGAIWVSLYRDPTDVGQDMGASQDAAGLFPAMYFTGMEGRSVQIDIMQTAAVIAGDNLQCWVTYGVL